ncbi:MAG: hypothetical protein E7635_07805, partial [Ruminococcaceae bacterium]|nr:hypothetical protein [Oscillospiraceae bacterium]
MKLNFKSLKRKLFGSSPGKKKNKKKSDKTNNIKKAVSAALAFVLVVTVVAIIAGSGGSSGGTKIVVKYVEPVLQSGNVTLSANGTYNYTPSEGYDGFSDFTVLVEGSNACDYNVTFMSDSESVYAGCGVNEGVAVSEPVRPTADGLYFDGWYTAQEGGDKVQFPYTPNGNTTLYARFTDVVLLGFTGLATSKDLTWTDDIAGTALYTIHDSSTTNTGVYVEVTSELDDMFPFCDIEEFTDDYGNVFVKYPKCYIKFITNDDGAIDGFKVSNVQAEEDMFIPDCFLDPSDSSGASYLDYFALGKYEMSGSSSQGFSKSGETCLVSITRAKARTASRSYGTSDNLYNGYQLQDFSMLTTYNFLCMLYYKTADIQSVYGGRTGSGSVSSWSSASVTGTCDAIEGLNGWNTDTDCVKMLGIENPYGNIYKWIDGIYFSSSSIYVFRLPQNFADSTSGAAKLSISRPTTSSYILSLGYTNTEAQRSYPFATATGDASSSVVGDYYYYNSSGTVLHVGGC